MYHHISKKCAGNQGKNYLFQPLAAQPLHSCLPTQLKPVNKAALIICRADQLNAVITHILPSRCKRLPMCCNPQLSAYKKCPHIKVHFFTKAIDLLISLILYIIQKKQAQILFLYMYSMAKRQAKYIRYFPFDLISRNIFSSKSFMLLPHSITYSTKKWSYNLIMGVSKNPPT